MSLLARKLEPVVRLSGDGEDLQRGVAFIVAPADDGNRDRQQQRGGEPTAAAAGADGRGASTVSFGVAELADKSYRWLGEIGLNRTHCEAARAGQLKVRDVVAAILAEGGDAEGCGAVRAIADGACAFHLTLRAPREAGGRWEFSDDDPNAGGDAVAGGGRQGRIAKTLAAFGTFDLQGLAAHIGATGARNILVMVGAGSSVAAGIPDFRTPGVGLYSQLGKYNLPRPEAVFSLEFLHQKPEIFYEVANDMQLWPGLFPPTHVHHFIKLLDERNMLLRCYTQNIDTLERIAGLSEEKVVEAHGSFATASCASASCKAPFDIAELQAIAERREVPRCAVCGSVAKPDVVFFGESLPAKFFELLAVDAPKADLVLIIGTSLLVSPFNMIPDRVAPHVPRVLINMQRAGQQLVFQNETRSLAQHMSRISLGADYSSSSSSSEGDDDDGQVDGGQEQQQQQRRRGWRPSREALEELSRQLYGAQQQLKGNCSSNSSSPGASARRFGGRDLFLRGDCQAAVVDLASALGFADTLQQRHAAAFIAVKGKEAYDTKFPFPH